MNKTKKGFLIAGGILAILGAFAVMIVSFAMAGVTEGVIREAILESSTDLTPDQIDQAVALGVMLVKCLGWFLLGYGIVNLVLGILILVKTSKGTIGKGLIITELVFAILGSSLLVTAFMIVALCIKDKPKADVETITV